VSKPLRGLGRGLGALLGDEPRPAAGTLVQVPVDRLRPNPRQPRQAFPAQALAELEQSIRELGVLVPVIVRPATTEGVYELIAGERRWRAASAAGLATIPAVVRAVDDAASLEVAVVENLQREDLDPVEEAMGLSHLIDEYGYTQERLAERLGRSRPAVANALRLLTLSDPIKAHVRSGALSAGHARALLAAPAGQREPLAERAVREGLTVREIERLGSPRVATSPATPPRVAIRDPHVEGVEGRLRYRLGARVAIIPAGRGGRIEVRYADEADLMRIVDVMLNDAP
jgi:ParB family transcriptional regulator, chromosome partitioning protein